VNCDNHSSLAFLAIHSITHEPYRILGLNGVGDVIPSGMTHKPIPKLKTAKQLHTFGPLLTHTIGMINENGPAEMRYIYGRNDIPYQA